MSAVIATRERNRIPVPRLKLWRRRPERGSVLVVVLALLAVMCLFMVAAGHSLFSLKRELKLIEQKQVQRQGNSTATP